MTHFTINKGQFPFKIFKSLPYKLFNYTVEIINSFYAVTESRTAREPS